MIDWLIVAAALWWASAYAAYRTVLSQRPYIAAVRFFDMYGIRWSAFWWYMRRGPYGLYRVVRWALTGVRPNDH